MEEAQAPEKQMLDKLLAERAELDQHIAFLQKRLGLPVSPSASLSPTTMASGSVDLASSGVHPGEFYGLSRPQAATAFLRKVGKPLTTTQIFEGLREASFDVSGKNALNVLYTALSRSPEVRKVAPNTWGLREWYPHLKEPKKRMPVTSDADDVLPLEATERKGK